VTVDLTAIGLTVLHDYVTAEEEAAILEQIGDPAKKKDGTQRNSIRRYGSNLPYNSDMVSKDIPSFLDAIGDRLVADKLVEVKPDSVTVNEYLKGQGIIPHTDSKSSGPVITVLCLKSHAVMSFSKLKDKKLSASVELPPRTLLQMRGEVRDNWLHGVPPVTDTRYSVVFRNGTPRVLKKTMDKK
jgi:DNA oxidative demethylase